MTRVKGGFTTRRRHKKILKQTKGYRGLRSKIYKQAIQAWMKAGLNAYKGRKLKKRDFRSLWISRISAGLKQVNKSYNYSRFINALKKDGVTLNRKVLADLALNHNAAFEKLAKDTLK
jgi:large subunit ribosomal protein L20